VTNVWSRELAIRADFNSRDAVQRFLASLRFAESAARPEVGEVVRLYDREGNSVMGVVEELDEMIVHVRPDMSTWSSTVVTLKISPEPASRAPAWEADPGITRGVVPVHASGVQVE
jgi:hypothetical protein